MDPGRRQAQGSVARQFLAEDARWVIDSVLSSQDSNGWKSCVALLLSHHFIRIAYEGVSLIRSSDSHAGWPTFAQQLPQQYEAITARARHVSKLLDDNKKTYEDITAELSLALRKSFDEFVTKTRWPVRWLADDLGIYLMSGQVLGGSIATAYRLGLDPSDLGAISNHSLSRVTEEWGGILAFCGSADLQPPLQRGSLNLPTCVIVGRDCRSKRYLERRYDPIFSIEAKLLLLMIEGDMNVNLNVLPLLSTGHIMPTFRARVVSLYHSLRSLNCVLREYPGAQSAGVADAKDLLSSDPAKRLLSIGGRRVRNRCVHYEMHERAFTPDTTRPMMGVVEAMYPGRSWESFNDDVLWATLNLAQILKAWGGS